MIFTDDQQKHLARVMAEYSGNGQELENALGSLCLGMLYGWKVVRVMHASASYAKYQSILQLRYSDWCPETTSLTQRHRGYQLARKAENFWDLIRGTEAAPDGYKTAKKEFA